VQGIAGSLGWALFAVFPGPQGPFSMQGNAGAVFDKFWLGHNYSGYYVTINFISSTVTTLFGTAMALGRFSSDNEMVALRTSGVSLFRISVPIVAISLRSPSKNFRIPSRAILSPLQN
jgi:hypothetical protein